MNIYQHYRPEEHAFIDKVDGWKTEVAQQYSVRLTDFLNPREQHITQQIIGNHPDVSLSFWGGSSYSERKRALLHPPFVPVHQEDYKVSCFEVNYPAKFIKLEHKDILGSLMNLGVKREKYGDIIVSGETIQIAAAGEIADYLSVNFEKAGRAAVSLKPLKGDLLASEEEYIEKSGTVTSLRLDAVMSEIYSISRSKASALISGSKVKVNWRTIENTSFEMAAGDHLSVRGYGRSKLISIDGQTKKDKQRISFGILK
ncbi:RNA-binding protein [Fictibacillus aquaticus]|uniref:RNA-binding protein n=1 Tax=Fictibacillus aquaticus TaxID=2021314 RepID=A0A235FC68_9BACL|nr:RNA-binding protein [Fictibacillus aquaticus]OYD58928.1 RNA-binding protein [Fictibacillus aquaticus]